MKFPAANHRSARIGRILPATLVAVALIGGAIYAYSRYAGGNKETSGDMLTYVAATGPFDHIVLEQGEIESSSNIDINCEVKSQGSGMGGIPILWVIEEGTYVKKGDKLVELDSASLETQLKAQKIAVTTAEATKISSEAMVKTAEIALQEYLEGTYLQERKLIESEIFVAQQNLKTADLELLSAVRMAARGQMKGLQVEAAEFAVANAKNVLEAATAKLRVLDELTKVKNTVQFQSDIDTAKAKLSSDVSVYEEELEKLKEYEDQMAKCIIHAPAEGVVVHNNKFSSRGGAEFVVEEGATVRERQTIIKLPDPTKMQVKTDVNESRVTLIREGMPAKIKVSAVEDELLAEVIRVNKYAEPGSWFSSAVKEYATYIEIQNPPESIRTGMTAEVRIFVEQLQDALQIPVHGIYEFKNRHFCLLKNQGGFETRQVKIGATNDKMVTIDDGLSEGEEIVLNPRVHLDLMELPEIDDVVGREALLEMSSKVPEGPAAGAAGGGGASSYVDTLFAAADSDGDGNISSDEASGSDNPMLKNGFSAMDGNSDGSLTKAEVKAAAAKFRSAGGGRGGAEGGGRPGAGGGGGGRPGAGGGRPGGGRPGGR